MFVYNQSVTIHLSSTCTCQRIMIHRHIGNYRIYTSTPIPNEHLYWQCKPFLHKFHQIKNNLFEFHTSSKVPVKKIVHSYILSTKILNFCFLNVQSVLFHNLHKCTSICVYWSISRHFIACSVVQCALIYSMPVDVLHTSMFVLFSSVCDNILINITQNMVTAFLKVYLHWNPCCSVTRLNLLFIIQWPT